MLRFSCVLPILPEHQALFSKGTLTRNQLAAHEKKVFPEGGRAPLAVHRIVHREQYQDQRGDGELSTTTETSFRVVVSLRQAAEDLFGHSWPPAIGRGDRSGETDKRPSSGGQALIWDDDRVGQSTSAGWHVNVGMTGRVLPIIEPLLLVNA